MFNDRRVSLYHIVISVAAGRQHRWPNLGVEVFCVPPGTLCWLAVVGWDSSQSFATWYEIDIWIMIHFRQLKGHPCVMYAHRTAAWWWQSENCSKKSINSGTKEDISWGLLCVLFKIWFNTLVLVDIEVFYTRLRPCHPILCIHWCHTLWARLRCNTDGGNLIHILSTHGISDITMMEE